MRKLLIALMLLAMLLGCATALAATDEDVSAAMIEKSEAAIDDMRKKADGWVKVMLDGLTIDGTEVKDKSVYCYVSVPDLSNALTSKDEFAGEAGAFLARCLADYTGKGNRVELKLNATWSEKDGKISLKWSGNSNPTKLNASLKNLAGKAKKTYTWKNFTAALEEYLLPKATVLPKKKPSEAPKIRRNNEYGKQVADALGVSTAMAARRLPALMMLMDMTKADTTDPLDSTVITIKIRDWQGMLRNLEPLALEELENTVGAPQMSREDMDAVLCARLNEAMLPWAYQTKGQKTVKITVDVTKAVTEGVGTAEELMAIYKDYMTAMDKLLDKLMDAAAALPFYPELALPEAGVTSGASHEGGRNVIFSTGQEHAVVIIQQNGNPVLTGFSAQFDRLMVQLLPGEYQVYFGKGTQWCGMDYLFSENGSYGMFTMTVADEGQTRVTLHESADGDAAVTPMTWDELRAMVSPSAKGEDE